MNRFRWLAVLLAASVAVNFGLLGFTVGQLLSGARVGPLHDPARGLFRSLRDLPEERRDELKPLLRSQMGGARPNLRHLRSAQRDVFESAAAEPFDRLALGDALQRFRDELLASQERGHRALVEVMAVLTEDERRQLLESMR